MRIRTDMACEAAEAAGAAGADGLPGVESGTEKLGDITVTRVRVLDSRGSAALGKPVGEYVTVDVPGLGGAQDETFSGALGAVARELGRMMRGIGGGVLVAGLGNAAMTPDALGPRCVGNILVTRHVEKELKKLPGLAELRPVSAIAPGVLGDTGMEAGEVLAAVASACRPQAVIAVDALVSRRASRLGRSVQISDTGIVPGSGVNNARAAVTRRTLGVPVFSLGVPTVVDLETLVCGVLAPGDGGGDGEARGAVRRFEDIASAAGGPMFVTPRFVDSLVEHAARLTGFAINTALNPCVPLGDMAALLS
jgi:spore protease